MAYTVADSPATVARIERDLATIVATVRAADPHLRSLVLTGGFARGEGAVLNGEPQNDYDLVAVRGTGRPRAPLARVRADLEREIGLHVDLAPVSAWRLRFVAPTIFWYETAQRGRVLWGEDLLARIPVRAPEDLDPAEGLRLLVNRAAGLLLATSVRDPHHHRIQASKALLAAADVHLLASGTFAPSQRERWALLAEARARGDLPEVERRARWLAWAFQFKVDPERAAAVDARDAWAAAREAVLAAVPAGLAHAGLPSLERYGRRDRLADHLLYAWRAQRLALHPTARVRVATLRLLEASPDGVVDRGAARACLGGLARGNADPLRQLEALRRVTLQ